MAEIEKKTKRYPTDLTGEEWARIEPFLPGAARSGRPARMDLREVPNSGDTMRVHTAIDQVLRPLNCPSHRREMARDIEGFPCRAGFPAGIKAPVFGQPG